MASELSLIYEQAKKVGFDLVGISDVTIAPSDHTAFLEWLKHNHHGSMSYLARDPEKRCNPEKILTGAKSVIMVALNYGTASTTVETIKIGQYANNKPDYHLIFEQKLAALCEALHQVFQEQDYRFAVDYGPLMERSFAAKSQMGFIGKNTTLITKEFGSWVLLGEVITTAELPPSPAQVHGRCGACTRCLTACPTGALKSAYELDSKLCISYLTIENKGPIPLELREKIGTWLFGCDICQDVCPHNVRAKAYVPEAWTEASISPDLRNPEYTSSKAFLIKILTIPDQESFKKFFTNTPFLRAKRVGLIRNACVVAGNLHEQLFIPYLAPLRDDPSEIIRKHAIWALEQIKMNMKN